MEENKYSEQDIQDYAAGIFTGDKSDLKAYLSVYPKAANQFKAYQNLFSLLNHEKTNSLSYNLADKVLAKLDQKEKAKEPVQFQLLPTLVIALTLVALVFTYRHFSLGVIFNSFPDSGLLILVTVLMFLFLGGFTLVELKQRRRKFAV